MAKIFKPRRGKKSTMAGSKKATVLSAGEMFIEVPDTGAGTGHSKMKIGDGSTQYSSLPYAMGDTENDKIAFSNDTSGNITTALNKVTSGAALKTMIAALKQAVSLANTSITQLNDERLLHHDYPVQINITNESVHIPHLYTESTIIEIDEDGDKVEHLALTTIPIATDYTQIFSIWLQMPNDGISYYRAYATSGISQNIVITVRVFYRL